MSTAGTAGTAGAAAPERPATSLDPTARDVWRAARGPVLLAALVLLGALVLALLRTGGSAGLLDPGATDRAGSRALAELLRAQGVEVRVTRTTSATVGAVGERGATTVLVTQPDLLTAEQVRRVGRTGADLVLVAPTGPALDLLAPGLAVVGEGGEDARGPGCGLPVAQRAGSAEVDGAAYGRGGPVGQPLALCYPAADGGAGLAVLDDPDRTVSVLGGPRPLTNDRLDDAGNAALALGLLGDEEVLVWYLPSLGDLPEGAQRPLTELLPGWVLPALAQLGVAVALLALWRARRLGPVVAEPLPVVVRASEAVEGRARLYRRSRARGTAASALRAAALERLRAALALGRADPPDAVVAAVAARSGRPEAGVRDLLYGAPPAGDAALVSLADALDALEREVRRT
ncbi:DUF4350 domain-containing protein [Vallicoccus soli]|uniref:DUF4350 domain-containing protein n=1 Tax=Vallicoccus soli TaxID=2339232 RepID=A0A3A3ZIV3_9ACTN|nr:DUF4350 domain-containing protein [Vallicoccus soli]RJK95402.1 DUF4350 domain-containing protein [Vallicoccus soli]